MEQHCELETIFLGKFHTDYWCGRRLVVNTLTSPHVDDLTESSKISGCLIKELEDRCVPCSVRVLEQRKEREVTQEMFRIWNNNKNKIAVEAQLLTSAPHAQLITFLYAKAKLVAQCFISYVCGQQHVCRHIYAITSVKICSWKCGKPYRYKYIF